MYITFSLALVRSRAGSGKTTTALLKLPAAVASYLARAQRQRSTTPVKVLVLTFNRTLMSYVEELARKQVPNNDTLTLDIFTASNWAKELSGNQPILDKEDGDRKLITLALQAKLGLAPDFLLEEVSYVLGDFLPANLELDDPAALLVALRQIAKAYGMAEVARRAELGEKTPFRAFSKNGNPSLTTVHKVLHAVGLRLRVTPI